MLHFQPPAFLELKNIALQYPTYKLLCSDPNVLQLSNNSRMCSIINLTLCRLKPTTEAKCKLNDHMRKASSKIKTQKKNGVIQIHLHLRHSASPQKAGEKKRAVRKDSTSELWDYVWYLLGDLGLSYRLGIISKQKAPSLSLLKCRRARLSSPGQQPGRERRHRAASPAQAAPLLSATCPCERSLTSCSSTHNPGGKEAGTREILPTPSCSD